MQATGGFRRQPREPPFAPVRQHSSLALHSMTASGIDEFQDHARLQRD